MKIPSFKSLTANSDKTCRIRRYAQGMHPNPRFYKYHWWIFWEQSPADGHAFLEDSYAMGTAAAMTLMDELVHQNKEHWIYNRRVPRLEPGITPFDPRHPKWISCLFAPALSSDPDPEWEGHR